MSNRQEKRKQTALLNGVIYKAKIDMQKWLDTLTDVPTESEVRAFQAGYIAGINRGSNVK